LGVTRRFDAVSLIASEAMASVMASPAAARGSRVLFGTASWFELTRNTSVLASLPPDLVRDPSAAPPALTPTNVGLTIAFVEGVADIVLFLT